jgi:hypothetical protein
MKKLFTFLLLGTSLHIHAQWSGPVGGTLSTNNRVHLNHTAPMGMGGGGSNFVFSVSVDDGFGPVIPSLRINDNNGTLEVGKTMQLTNGAGFVMRRSNNTNVLSVAPIGSMRLTTDGFNNPFRGFFVNNGTDDFFSVTQSQLLFKDQGQELFKVNADGYAYARKMVVTLANPFPDYVFANNYNLMPLSDLAAFIAKNKHLPNMPSAQQIANNDNQVELGDMQTRLLEKVEELTLYILQQQQQIEELQRKLASQN